MKPLNNNDREILDRKHYCKKMVNYIENIFWHWPLWIRLIKNGEQAMWSPNYKMLREKLVQWSHTINSL